jgi:hypothetical protein
MLRKEFMGGKPGEFYSGLASDLQVAGPYCEFVRQFIPLNINRPHGFHARPPDIRLDEAPFHCRTETVMEVPFAPGELVRTVLIV